jgi:hypothetical protein
MWSGGLGGLTHLGRRLVALVELRQGFADQSPATLGVSASSIRSRTHLEPPSVASLTFWLSAKRMVTGVVASPDLSGLRPWPLPAPPRVISLSCMIENVFANHAAYKHFFMQPGYLLIESGIRNGIQRKKGSYEVSGYFS